MIGLLVLVGAASAGEQPIRLVATPRTFQVLPGQPIRLKLTVQAPTAAALPLHVPDDPLLVLRAVEKFPLQRTPEGLLIHRRVILWQAVEPGKVRMDGLSVEVQGRERRFPEITITVIDPGT